MLFAGLSLETASDDADSGHYTRGVSKAYRVGRVVFVVLGFIVSVLTAPVLVHSDIPEGFKWWRRELGDVGGDDLQLLVLVVGLSMIVLGWLAPHIYCPGDSRTSSQRFSDEIKREGRRVLKQRRKRQARLASEIAHRDGCPKKRIEFSAQTTPEGHVVETAHCLDCGEIVYLGEDGDLRREAETPTDAEAERPDPAQLWRAINGARAKLTRQRDLLIQRRYDRLDPDDRGEWETEDRKGIMHQDARFRATFLAVEEAFDAISLMDDPTEEHRDNAIAKIDVALHELDSAWEIAEGRAAPDRRQAWTPPPYEPPPEAFEAFALLEQALGLRGVLVEWESDERAKTLFPTGPTYKRLHRLLELAEDVVRRAPRERTALPDFTSGISNYERAVAVLRRAIRELREVAAMKDPPGRFARIGELNESAEALLSVMADAQRGVPTLDGLDGHRDRLVRWTTYMDEALRQAGADEVQLAYFNQETELTLHGPSGDENEQIGQFMDDLKVRRARAREIVAELRGRDEE